MLENGRIRATVLFLGSPTDKKLPVDTGDIDKIQKDSVPFVSEPFPVRHKRSTWTI